MHWGQKESDYYLLKGAWDLAAGKSDCRFEHGNWALSRMFWLWSAWASAAEILACKSVRAYVFEGVP
jgi:hypothetical protein